MRLVPSGSRPFFSSLGKSREAVLALLVRWFFWGGSACFWRSGRWAGPGLRRRRFRLRRNFPRGGRETGGRARTHPSTVPRTVDGFKQRALLGPRFRARHAAPSSRPGPAQRPDLWCGCSGKGGGVSGRLGLLGRPRKMQLGCGSSWGRARRVALSLLSGQTLWCGCSGERMEKGVGLCSGQAKKNRSWAAVFSGAKQSSRACARITSASFPCSRRACERPDQIS